MIGPGGQIVRVRGPSGGSHKKRFVGDEGLGLGLGVIRVLGLADRQTLHIAHVEAQF